MSECQYSVKNAVLNFPEPWAISEASSDCFFKPNNCPKHEDSSFVIMDDTDKLQILTFKRLNQQFFLHNHLKND